MDPLDPLDHKVSRGHRVSVANPDLKETKATPASQDHRESAALRVNVVLRVNRANQVPLGPRVTRVTLEKKVTQVNPVKMANPDLKATKATRVTLANLIIPWLRA